MKRFFKGEKRLSRDEIERQAAAELAAATSLGEDDPSLRSPGVDAGSPPDTSDRT